MASYNASGFKMLTIKIPTCPFTMFIYFCYTYLFYRRLQVKAERTKNPIIKKKIRLRTGQWFFELQSQSNPNLSDRTRGTVKVRESIRVTKPKSKFLHIFLPD